MSLDAILIILLAISNILSIAYTKQLEKRIDEAGIWMKAKYPLSACDFCPFCGERQD